MRCSHSSLIVHFWHFSKTHTQFAPFYPICSNHSYIWCGRFARIFLCNLAKVLFCISLNKSNSCSVIPCNGVFLRISSVSMPMSVVYQTTALHISEIRFASSSRQMAGHFSATRLAPSADWYAFDRFRCAMVLHIRIQHNFNSRLGWGTFSFQEMSNQTKCM